jgi:hypothetical protein
MQTLPSEISEKFKLASPAEYRNLIAKLRGTPTTNLLDAMTPKRKRWLWIAFWTALAIVTALMWPWDWAGW